MNCYDKYGKRLTTKEWASILDSRDEEHIRYRQVGHHSSHSYDVSTVWLGLDHGWDGKLAIFETLVRSNSGGTVEMQRYATLHEAEVGHKQYVLKWLGVVIEEPVKPYKPKGRFSDL